MKRISILTIKQGLRIMLPLLMLFALPMMNSCKDKEDDPVTPPTPQPDPTDTIVIPTKEKTFDWDWVADYHISGWTPPFDSIKKYIEDPTYKYIYMNMVNKGANPACEGLEGSPCGGYATHHFRRACDSVYSVADKCNGKFRMTGIINVNKVVPDTVAIAQGIWERDSADLAALGANIVVPGR